MSVSDRERWLSTPRSAFNRYSRKVFHVATFRRCRSGRPQPQSSRWLLIFIATIILWLLILRSVFQQPLDRLLGYKEFPDK